MQDDSALVQDDPAPPGSTRFWAAVDRLVATSAIVIDRPKASQHPRIPEAIYPVAYGYLEGTTSGDGQGIDVWVGSVTPGAITGVVCTVDMEKRDAELKLLLGCTDAESSAIVCFLNKGTMSAILIPRVAL
jgi:inorganic pyrophosphatase